MHKAYQPVTPATNKLLQQRWDNKYYNEHRRMVFESRPMVDTKPPQTYMHLHLKLKKLQLEEERLATIERDNRILLEKMSYIMRTKGRVDNRNNYEYKSLNREKRMRELLRVTQENQDILKRITARKPEYDHREWEDDWQKNQNFMDNISAYPRDWWKYQPQQSGRVLKREKTDMSRTGKSRQQTRQSTRKSQREEKSEERDEEEQKSQAEGGSETDRSSTSGSKKGKGAKKGKKQKYVKGQEQQSQEKDAE